MTPGFSTPALLTFRAGSFFVVENCPVHCSITGLYPPDASSMHPTTPPTTSCNNQKCLQVLPNVPGEWGTKLSPSENHCCKGNLTVVIYI